MSGKPARRKRKNRKNNWAPIAAIAASLVILAAAILIRVSMDQAARELREIAELYTPLPQTEVAPEQTAAPGAEASVFAPEMTADPAPSAGIADRTPSPADSELPDVGAEATLEPTPTPTPAPTKEPPRVKVKYPYAILVDRGAQVVTVLTIGETGAYDVVARQMICSTDKYKKKPTNGVYKLDGQHKRWLSTLTGSYAQYATRISGTILFHSIPYSRKREDSMMTDEYYKLGRNVSEGCVRLTCEDAKWIYDNIPAGTLVRFFTGTYDEARLAELVPPALSGGKWDPTDANAKNPSYIGHSYHAQPVATPYPYVTPAPTSYKISVWHRPG